MLKGRVVVSLTGTKLLDIECDIISHHMTAKIILFTKNFKPNNLCLTNLGPLQNNV
jgi:hypothetical protein